MYVQVWCLCMLVADGGPAHPWQVADRHLQEAEAYRALLDELMWCMVHNYSTVRWGPVVFLIHQHEGYSFF